MTMNRLLGLCFALLLAACGEEPRANAAAGATFSYGAPQPATAEQAAAMSGPISSIAAFRSTQGSSSGLGASDLAGVTGQLFASGAFAPSGLGTMAGAGFDVPACAAVASGKVTFTGCKVTVSQSSGGNTITGSVTVDGSVSLSANGQTLGWELTFGIDLALAGASSGTISARSHTKGTVAATDTTASGSMTGEHSLTVSAGGQTVSAALDESLTFDVTHSSSCATGVTGGTLEAKRVWVTRPGGASPAQLPDEAVKVQWTGCGMATVQVGTH
jgi:hypothetical protein